MRTATEAQLLAGHRSGAAAMNGWFGVLLLPGETGRDRTFRSGPFRVVRFGFCVQCEVRAVWRPEEGYERTIGCGVGVRRAEEQQLLLLGIASWEIPFRCPPRPPPENSPESLVRK